MYKKFLTVVWVFVAVCAYAKTPQTTFDIQALMNELLAQEQDENDIHNLRPRADALPRNEDDEDVQPPMPTAQEIAENVWLSTQALIRQGVSPEEAAQRAVAAWSVVPTQTRE